MLLDCCYRIPENLLSPALKKIYRSAMLLHDKIAKILLGQHLSEHFCYNDLVSFVSSSTKK
jgi:hypothetical protein